MSACYPAHVILHAIFSAGWKRGLLIVLYSLLDSPGGELRQLQVLGYLRYIGSLRQSDTAHGTGVPSGYGDPIHCHLFQIDHTQNTGLHRCDTA